MFSKVFSLQICVLLFASFAYCQVTPLPNGFAHNDYLHKRPLLEALDNGYTNIEADIFLHHNSLVVAHYFPFFKQKRTLENLYLKPLENYMAARNGEVYHNYSKPVILMIDIKTDAAKTYRALKPYLEKYAPILSVYDNGKIIPGKVTVVLSGNKPYALIKAEKRRLAFIDDDLRNISADTLKNDVFVLASCKYSKLLKWRGEGDIPAGEYDLLRKSVNAAHKRGEKVRLWASPDNPFVWQTLLSCGVDCINTDRLSLLKSYLVAYNKPQ